MKLAEALAERKALQVRVRELTSRCEAAVRVQEGDVPPEAAEDLLAAIAATLDALESLMIRINRTNVQARLPGGETVMEAIARRDRLKAWHAALHAAADAAVAKADRWGRQEIRYVTTVDVADLRGRVDEAARHLREVDTAIQAANWQVDLFVATAFAR